MAADNRKTEKGNGGKKLKNPEGRLWGWEAGESIEKLLRGDEKIEKVIGSGAESVVVSLKGNNKEVVAYNYNGLDPVLAKVIFYQQRTYSTLFPHNFPHFHAAFGSSEKKR